MLKKAGSFENGTQVTTVNIVIKRDIYELIR